MNGRSASRAMSEVVLSIGAVGGALCLLVALSAWTLGTRVLVVESGSMEPAIMTGSLIVTRDVPARDLRVGDVVTVPALSGQRVTHRIVRITHRGAEATIALKGDANKVPDPQVHTVSSAGRLLFGIPFLGRVIAVLSSPIGLLLLGAYLFFVARVAMEEWAHRGPAGPRRGRERGGRRRGGARRATGVAAGIVALTAGLAAVTGAGPKGTVAAFTDTVAVGTSTMSTSSVPAPTLSCGPLGVLSVGFTWSSVSGATNYTLFYNNGSSSTTVSGLSTTITGALNLSSTAWVVANRNFGSTTWLSARSNSKNYTFLAVVSLCS